MSQSQDLQNQRNKVNISSYHSNTIKQRLLAKSFNNQSFHVQTVIYNKLGIDSQQIQSIAEQVNLQTYYHFEPYLTPPNLALCVKHHSCTNFGINVPNSMGCPCCNGLEKSSIPLNCPLIRLNEISPAYNFFFFLIKSLGGMCLAALILTGFPQYFQMYTLCQDEQISELCFDIFPFSFGNHFRIYILPTQTDFDIYFSYVCAIMIILFNIYSTYQHQKIYIEELKKVKPQDYSLVIEGINHANVKKYDLETFFKDYEVEIMYTYKIRLYMQLTENKCKMLNRISYLRENERNLDKTLIKLQQVQDKLKEFQENLSTKDSQQTKTDKVFIAFKTVLDKTKFQKEFAEHSLLVFIKSLLCIPAKMQINGDNLYVKQLSNPSEIVWSNLQYPDWRRYIVMLIALIVQVFVFSLAVFFIFWLTLLSKAEKNTNQPIYIQYLPTIIVTFINAVSNIISDGFIKLQKNYQKSDQNVKSTTSLCMMAFFFNIMVTQLIANIFRYFRQLETGVKQITILLITASFVYPLMNFVNAQMIYKIYQRVNILKQKKENITQIQANQIFEKADFNISEKASAVFKLSLMSVLLTQFYPIIIFLPLIGFVLMYWIYKYLLLRQSRIQELSYKITLRINKMFYLLSPVYTSGIMFLYLDSRFLNLLISCVAISAFNWFFAEHIVFFILKRDYPQLQQLNSRKMTLEEAIKSGMIDYKHVNPTSIHNPKSTQFRQIFKEC